MSEPVQVSFPEEEMAANLDEREATQSDTVPAHESAAHPNAPIESPGGVPRLGIIFLAVLFSAIGYGIYARHASEAALSLVTREASVLTVSVVHPTPGSQADDLALPGNVQAFTETPIYSRTDGYLKKWYFDIGSHVRRGQLLADIETPEVDQQLNQSRAELERIQANEQLAGVTSNRWQALLAKHAVSQQEADQAKSNFIAAQAAVDASRANVHRLEQMQNYEKIVAPFDGVITARNTDIGDLINAGAGAGSANPRELFHLAAINKLRVYVAVPEVDSDAIHDGETAYLTEDSNPDLKIPGRIVRNSDAIDHATRTLNVEVDVNNGDGVLRPGAYVFAHFHLPARNSSVTVPSNTLLFRAEGLRVGVVRDNRVQLVPVTIGHDFGSSVEVTSGLTPQNQVILDPSDSLASGMEVHAKPAPAGGRS
jgi:RND family efflux transporter MFP subunit